MEEWNFSPEVIAKAQEIGIGARIAIHWTEAEAQDQEGTVVGVEIRRYGKVDYTVHIDGDLSPTDGFVHDIAGIKGGTIRLIPAGSVSATPMAKDALRHAFRNADRSDWEHLFAVLPDTGRGKFWKSVFKSARAALESPC